MSKILITGASGFIGRALCKVLEIDHEVITLDRSRGNITNPTTFLSLEKVEYVFHLAARSFVPDSWNETSDFLNANVIGTTNVLEYCKSLNIPLTYVSAYVYGLPNSLPLNEDALIKPNNPYALSKYLAEQVCQFYATYHNLNITIIRPFNIYGPGQATPFLIPKIINQVKKNLTIELFDLSPKRDYVYIDDVIDALVRTFEFKLPGFNVLNIGSGKSISVDEVVEHIQNVAGSNLDVKSQKKYRRDELNNVFADISQSFIKLKWIPLTTFEEGIKRTYND